MTGYTRQSAASIVDGLVVNAADHNAEFNQLQSAFDGATGHAHDGSTGSGPILTASAMPATFAATNIQVTAAANLTLGSGTALATSATTGLIGIPTCAGTPTGVPSGHVTGTAQLIFDTTNSILYSYNNGTSAWVGTSGLTKVSQQAFTANGTYTPTAGMKYCRVQMVGSGAGGFTTASGIGGGGGGAGEYAEGVFSAATIGASQAVTIGAAGAASSNGNTTSLGALLTAVGGSASTNSIVGQGGIGGTGGTGTGTHIPGGDGGVSSQYGATSFWGGLGGSSYFGGGGTGGAGNLDTGKVGKAYGSGGGGGGLTSATYSAGGAGKGGLIIITEYQ